MGSASACSAGLNRDPLDIDDDHSFAHSLQAKASRDPTQVPDLSPIRTAFDVPPILALHPALILSC